MARRCKRWVRAGAHRMHHDTAFFLSCRSRHGDEQERGEGWAKVWGHVMDFFAGRGPQTQSEMCVNETDTILSSLVNSLPTSPNPCSLPPTPVASSLIKLHLPPGMRNNHCAIAFAKKK
jgi:hypothetical protein